MGITLHFEIRSLWPARSGAGWSVCRVCVGAAYSTIRYGKYYINVFEENLQHPEELTFPSFGHLVATQPGSMLLPCFKTGNRLQDY